MPPIDRFEVGFAYCNDVRFEHQHEVVKDAAEEYAHLLAEAIEPSPGENSKKVHLREVWMIAYNTERQVSHQVDSGIFPCDHRPAKEDG